MPFASSGLAVIGNKNNNRLAKGDSSATTNPPRGRIASTTTSQSSTSTTNGRTAVRSPALIGVPNQTSRGSIPVSRQDLNFDPQNTAFRYNGPGSLITSLVNRQSSF